MANCFPASGLAYADAFSVGTADAAASSLYVRSACTQAVRIEHTFSQTNLHHNTLWLKAMNSGDKAAASIGFTVCNNGGDHHRANIEATGNSGTSGGNLALYTRNNSGADTLGLYIDHAGNVGIGTCTPGERLSVNGNQGQIQLRVDTSDGSTINVRPNSGRCGWVSFTEDAVADRWGIGIKNGDAKLYFSSGNVASGGGTTRMVLDGSGNVGIGISTPQSALHVAGTLAVNPTCTGVHVGIDSGGYAGIQLTGGTSQGGYIDFSCTGTDAPGRIIYYITSNSMDFTVCAASRMTIVCNGNIGVATANPSYRLHVNGTFYAAGSSIKYKEGICNYDTDSCLFMCLKPVTYQYKDEWQHLGRELKSQSQIGLIAEDVAEVMPELAILVNEEDEKVVRNVDYEKLSVVLLKEVQKLRLEVDQLKNNK